MRIQNAWRRFTGALLSTLLAGSWGLSAEVSAANLALSPLPLYLGGAVEPNVQFTLDDSGSMYWSFMPDGIFWDYWRNRAKAPEYNRVYYNPWVTYSPPIDSSGVPMANASFTAAWSDGYAKDCKVNLASSYRPTWYYGYNCDNYNEWLEYTSNTKTPAYYYIYYTNHPQGAKPKPDGCDNSLNDDDCYIKVTVGADTGPGNSDERQNFANWYSYYRRRMFTAKAAIGRAFSEQGSGMRVGFGAINNGIANIDGVKTQTISRGVRKFTGADRTQFFNLLYGEVPTGSTPLRRAVDDVGQYFERADAKGPWNETPGQSGGSDLICRQSYHIIMSDGYWNSSQAGTSGARQNNDGTNGPTITGPGGKSYTFQAVSPFKDGHSNTLADVATYYWKRDLRTDIANEVPTNADDPAFWQHLVTFTVGLGVDGTVTPADAFDAISTGAKITWPDPSSSDPAKIDDMLHAAVDSRGGFFSAKDPVTFSNALSSILKTITDRTSSSAAVALNSGSIYSGSQLYQARFKTEHWDGELLAYPINSDGSVGVQAWNAADKIPSYNNRKIFTNNGSDSGTPFSSSGLTSAQLSVLGGQTVLDYLRGDSSNEVPNGSLRNRTSRLGDIINSAPLYVGPPALSYPDNWGAGAAETSSPYSAYAAANTSRSGVVYVGANDGMLHAFDATSGVELFAFVPGSVFDNMQALSDPNYTHRYYVDGTPVALDAYFKTKGAWRTVLAGGLNGGGQGIYALDVTDVPSGTESESIISQKLLWEFDDSDDADLGYTFSRPNIVRLQNGDWAVVFGNGYNNTAADGSQSSTGDAVLYIVDIETGALIKKIDTKVGSADDPLGQNRPNGLSTVAPVDVDGDYVVDYIYGGDLFGNLWKFDLSNTNANQWKVAFGSTNTPKPLFRARFDATDASTAQPITVRPQIGRHPTGSGYLIYFGTGKYLELGDNQTTGETTQTFYAVWDQNASTSTPPFDRTSLQQQRILKEVSVSGYEYRITTGNTVVWDDEKVNGVAGKMGWYLDLVNTEGGNTSNYGERQVTDPILRGDRIIFTTLLPSVNACEFGGSGWLMELDARTGVLLPYSPFDVNSDGVFSSADYINAGDLNGDGTSDTVPASGKKSKVGILPTPAILTDQPNRREFKYESGSTGNIEVTKENPGLGDAGRKSWIELIR